MRWLTAILFLLATSFLFAQNPILRRVCQDPNNNTLFWNNPTYSCTNFHFYIIWASSDNLTFFPVDSNYNNTSETHIHLNANSNPGTPNRYYFIERRDSCGPIFNHNSDTIEIDVINPPFTFLDSVSVNINTNQVVLGWRKNPLPDFRHYLTYKDNPYVLISPGGLTDTFQTDLTITTDPSIRSYEYDINTIDSCGNPSIFGINPHATIHLSNLIDTCAKTNTLKWNHYKGWRGIKKYYIYQDSGTGYFLLDSVPGNINQFIQPIVLGTTYQYFVRAFKDTSIILSSSSNAIQFSTRKRVDPAFININYITTDPNTETVILNFRADQAGETKQYQVSVWQNNVLTTTLYFSKSDINLDLNTGLSWLENYQFTVEAINYCDIVTLKSEVSTNILQAKIESNNNVLTWNSYFTWNTGVEKYIISRGTGEGKNYSFIPWNETLDTFIIDTQDFQNAKANGVCYYITAVKNSSPDTISNSNIICFPYPFTVFFPNAFIPTGVNNLFRPGGASIDYEKSTFQIYDRWGKLVHSDFIKDGWNGSDQQGNLCMDGLYYYKAEVFSIKNEKLTKNGSVTLLR